MRLSRPITTWATTSIHSRGVSPWLMPRSNRSTVSGTCANKGSSASLRISSRATSASRRSTTTPVRSAASIRAFRKASRNRIGRVPPTALLPVFGASDIAESAFMLKGAAVANLSVTMFSAKTVCSQRLAPLIPLKFRRPHPDLRMRPPDPWTFLLKRGQAAAALSGRYARGLFDDRKAHAGLVTVLFRDRTPGILGLFSGLERALHLGRAFHQLVEVHRAELAADHPEIAALCHDSLLLFSCLDADFRALRLELRGFGGVVKCRGRRGAAADGGRHQVEVSGADFALMARRRIAVLFGCELRLLQAGVSRHAFGLVAARQFEHAVVERVEARQGHKLEFVAHRADFALEFGDGRLVDIGFPVERRRAVIRQHLAGIDLVHGLGEFLCLFEVRGRGFPPQQVGVFCECNAALDAMGETAAGLEPVKAFGGAIARYELAVALVDIGGNQLGALGIGASQDKSRRATDVGGEPCCDQIALMRRGRDQHL